MPRIGCGIAGIGTACAPPKRRPQGARPISASIHAAISTLAPLWGWLAHGLKTAVPPSRSGGKPPMRAPPRHTEPHGTAPNQTWPQGALHARCGFLRPFPRPHAGFTGTDTFTYRVCAAAPYASVCETAAVTLNVHTPAPVPADHPLALLGGMAAIGWLARRQRHKAG